MSGALPHETAIAEKACNSSILFPTSSLFPIPVDVPPMLCPSSIINNLTNAAIAGSGDLRLATAAPGVVDQGQPLAEVTQDIDCDIRPNGGGYDIGADEI